VSGRGEVKMSTECKGEVTVKVSTEIQGKGKVHSTRWAREREK
jgi:hypothetical protein